MRLFWLFLLAILLLAPTILLAQKVDPAGSGPNFTSTPQSLQEVIQNIFNLALLVSGILAFGAVIYGAFMYTFSAGNPGMQSDARDQILQAFLGLALLLGSYLILNTLNPNLTRITLNPLPAITAPESQSPKTPPIVCPCGGGGGCNSKTRCIQDSLNNWGCLEVHRPDNCSVSCSGTSVCVYLGGVYTCKSPNSMCVVPVTSPTEKECTTDKQCVDPARPACWTTDYKCHATPQPTEKECDTNKPCTNPTLPVCWTTDYKCHPKPLGSEVCEFNSPNCPKVWQVCQPILNSFQGQCEAKCRSDQNPTGFLCPNGYSCNTSTGLCKK